MGKLILTLLAAIIPAAAQYVPPAPIGAGSGSVTSVGLSMPATFCSTGSAVTISGTLTCTYATGQTANRIFGTNASGNVGSFALTTAMLPSIASTLLSDSSSLVRTTDTGSVTNTMLAGSIASTKIDVSSLTANSVLFQNAGVPGGVTGSSGDTNGIRKFTYSQFAAPSAPVAALVSVAGNVGDVDTIGDHDYCVAFTTGTPDPIYQGQMTECSAASNSVTTDAGHGQVTITIPVGPSEVTGRIIYREDFASGVFSYLTTVSDNTSTTYTDNRSDDVLGCSDDICTTLYGDSPAKNSTGGSFYSGGNLLGNWTPEGLRIGKIYFQPTGLGTAEGNGLLPLFSLFGTRGIFLYGGNPTLSGSGNSQLGFQGLHSLTTAVGNDAVGYQALYHATTGGGNDAVGYQALFNLEGGTNNVALGNATMTGLTSGIGNTGLGQNAGSSVTTGQFNTFIGQYAGLDSNGQNGVVTGSKNTFIGEDSHTTKTDLMNAVCIGPNCDVEQDGQIVLGNAVDTTETLLYGRVRTVLHTPASSSEACTAGQFSDDANFHYVCVSSGVWKRAALSSF